MFEIVRCIDAKGALCEETSLAMVAERERLKHGQRWLVLIDRGAPEAFVTAVLDELVPSDLDIVSLDPVHESPFKGALARDGARLIDLDDPEPVSDEATELAELIGDEVVDALAAMPSGAAYRRLAPALTERLRRALTAPVLGIRTMIRRVEDTARRGDPVPVLVIAGPFGFLASVASDIARRLHRPIWVCAPRGAPVLQQLTLSRQISDFQWLAAQIDSRWGQRTAHALLPRLRQTHRMVLSPPTDRGPEGGRAGQGDQGVQGVQGGFSELLQILRTTSPVLAVSPPQPSEGDAAFVPALARDDRERIDDLFHPLRCHRLPAHPPAPSPERRRALRAALLRAAGRADERLAREGFERGVDTALRRFVLATTMLDVPDLVTLGVQLFDEAAALGTHGRVSSVLALDAQAFTAQCILAGSKAASVPAVALWSDARGEEPSRHAVAAMSTTRLAAADALTAERLSALRGQGASPVEPIGSLALDHALRSFRAVDEVAAADAGPVPQQLPVVLYVPAPGGLSEVERDADSICRALAGIGLGTLMVRHARQDAATQEALVRRLEAVYARFGIDLCTVADDVALPKVIKAADLVLTPSPETATLAVGLRRSVVLTGALRPPDARGPWPVLDVEALGLAPRVEGPADLLATLQQALGPHRAAFTEVSSSATGGQDELMALRARIGAESGEPMRHLFQDGASALRLIGLLEDEEHAAAPQFSELVAHVQAQPRS
ncbi:MAG: hypothetical protein AAFV62_00605 [Pseudomonadota bacterium]